MIRIGKYNISKLTMDSHKVGIFIEGEGEGGFFSVADFEKVVAKFYSDNF